MELTDDELEAVYAVLYDEYFYGKEYMYRDDAEGHAVGAALSKVRDEIKRRGL